MVVLAAGGFAGRALRLVCLPLHDFARTHRHAIRAKYLLSGKIGFRSNHPGRWTGTSLVQPPLHDNGRPLCAGVSGLVVGVDSRDQAFSSVPGARNFFGGRFAVV